MPHCWKSHVTAQIFYFVEKQREEDRTVRNFGEKICSISLQNVLAFLQDCCDMDIKQVKLKFLVFLREQNLRLNFLAQIMQIIEHNVRKIYCCILRWKMATDPGEKKKKYLPVSAHVEHFQCKTQLKYCSRC